MVARAAGRGSRFVFVLLLLLVCAITSAAEHEQASPLFFDSFDSPGSQWRASPLATTLDYEDGELLLRCADPEHPLGALVVPLGGDSISSFSIETTAYKYSGPPHASFGISWYLSSGALYNFAVTSGMYYSVMCFQDGEQEVIVPVAASPHIHGRSAHNHIRVDVIDNRATISINEEPLAAFDHEPGGMYIAGVYAFTIGDPVEVRFTEFAVRIATGPSTTDCRGLNVRITSDKAEYAIGESMSVAIELTHESDVVVYDRTPDGNTHAIFRGSLQAGTHDLTELLSVARLTVTGPPGVETIVILATSIDGCATSSEAVFEIRDE